MGSESLWVVSEVPACSGSCYKVHGVYRGYVIIVSHTASQEARLAAY